jgi:hypothetical protein
MAFDEQLAGLQDGRAGQPPEPVNGRYHHGDEVIYLL